MTDVYNPYAHLVLPRKINGASTVGELADRGCPICGGKLYYEASFCFGLLHCTEHGAIWQWIPTFRERRGYAPYKWKNHVTGETSKEWRKWKSRRGD